ncbi:MAG TPA: 50S ribosomal protein L19 [Phycisphaerae bacterium]|nr:50S ribosomal protein L19 [Phycisphaerae bacterium]HOJ75896.1 50S ribosomal protein L19 [Phycisphaerae bacterium]HOM52328.1 50S ribosomal protein L19 [Phycisphaerae bacterium]HON69314.1 50S ribosomal protein L19 [Phycisphaerae bacterium]HOQ87968.1 50S ribosomal protein L19 [Phycisphaerae bacterium]
MIHPLIQAVEDSAKGEKLADFQIGDTVTVYVRIVEGDKKRVQPYTGVVIARRGRGMGETFTVRRIVNNEGVERIFPMNSPKIAKIEVVRSGHVRRAKLYYLRDRVGKATRVKDKRRPTSKQAKAAEAAAAEAKS